MKSWRSSRSGWSRYPFFFLLVVIGASQGCIAGTSLAARPKAELGSSDSSAPVAWFAPVVPHDRESLARWRESVGPPVTPEPFDDHQPHDAITLVSWNTAVGDADIVSFVRSLPATTGPLVLLLQEVYRAGPGVPSKLDGWSAYAGRLGGSRPVELGEIENVGRALGLSVYYVPSMRNGDATSDEDRGNAILSNLSLNDLEAMELPFERQRRVAIAATIEGHTTANQPWRLRLVSAHLDNMGSAKRAWIGAEYGRARQARGLVDLLDGNEPTVLAGDFNTWFGFADQAYVETARAFPETQVSDRRPTFRGLLRLDHVFYRLAPGWRLTFHRGESRFGSDHYPLVGSLQFR
jgi:endonuclease/exonuclease/phosphatase family metal-dependent hydrolase